MERNERNLKGNQLTQPTCTPHKYWTSAGDMYVNGLEPWNS